MGFRTVVVLNNDLTQDWEKDAELGRKISRAASLKGWADLEVLDGFRYGTVIEQVHADCQTVAFLDGYSGEAIAHIHWFRDQTPEQKNLAMLKAAADALGYRVVKKPAKKA